MSIDCNDNCNFPIKRKIIALKLAHATNYMAIEAKAYILFSPLRVSENLYTIRSNNIYNHLHVESWPISFSI